MIKVIALFALAAAAAMAAAVRPPLAGSSSMYLILLGTYSVLGAAAAYLLWQDGSLRERLSPRWGDLSIGAVSAAALLVASWAARSVLAPAGTPQQAWMVHIYLQIGDAELIQRSSLVMVAVVAVSLLEELVWRGYALSALEERVGSRRAWPLSALLYGLTLLPTVFTLADPVAGPNPLLFVGALGCGIVWSFLAHLTGRLPPVMISHAAFTYFSVAQFRWPGLG